MKVFVRWYHHLIKHQLPYLYLSVFSILLKSCSRPMVVILYQDMYSAHLNETLWMTLYSSVINEVYVHWYHHLIKYQGTLLVPLGVLNSFNIRYYLLIHVFNLFWGLATICMYPHDWIFDREKIYICILHIF